MREYRITLPDDLSARIEREAHRRRRRHYAKELRHLDKDLRRYAIGVALWAAVKDPRRKQPRYTNRLAPPHILRYQKRLDANQIKVAWNFIDAMLKARGRESGSDVIQDLLVSVMLGRRTLLPR